MAIKIVDLDSSNGPVGGFVQDKNTHIASLDFGSHRNGGAVNDGCVSVVTPFSVNGDTGSDLEGVGGPEARFLCAALSDCLIELRPEFWPIGLDKTLALSERTGRNQKHRRNQHCKLVSRLDHLDSFFTSKKNPL